MNSYALIEQGLNGLQTGVMLFMIAAGLTLVFGIMNLVNMAQGSLYMLGAYFASTIYQSTGIFVLALLATLIIVMAISAVVELLVVRNLYHRTHLDQVLATFGLILFFNEAVRLAWGAAPVYAEVPPALNWRVTLLPGFEYPVFRLIIIAVGLLTAVFLYWLIGKTRLGMLIRAGASDRAMVGALGVNIGKIFTLIFALGGGLAAIAGGLAGPILAVQPGMGESILILSFVVVVVGGIGSVRGAFVAALSIGLVDTFGRAFLRDVLALFLPTSLADGSGSAVAAMLIYVFMAVVLFFKPQGLFSAKGG
jgi:branched-chain amino acid transport system permease protein